MHGLSDSIKRKKVFLKLKDMQPDIVLLQETHSTKNCQKIWKNNWNGHIAFANGESNARGVMTMFNKNLKFKLLKQEVVIAGRVLNLVIQIEQMKFLISNIYAPNNDDLWFFEKTIASINSEEVDHVVVGGDFNLHLQESDHYSSRKIELKVTKVASLVNTFLEEEEWVDVWRHGHTNVKQFTWKCRNPISMSQLDYFICLLHTL